MLKVLHLNCDYIWTTLHQKMMMGFAPFDIENTVFSPVRTKEGASITYNNNEIIEVCFSKLDRFFYMRKQKKIIKTVENIIDISKFDILHAYYLFTDGNYARYLSRKYNIPYVVAVRNTDVNYFFKKRPLLRNRGVAILRDAHKVFFLSEAYRDSVINHFVPSCYQNEIIKKSVVIPNGIDEFWFHNKNTNRNYIIEESRFQEKKIKLVYAGSVDKNKNIALTLQAISILEEQGWNIEFDVIGKIVDNDIYRKIEKNKAVHYYKQMGKEDLIKRYRAADIFVMPSHKETFGLVYAEAMSQGLPVIYTRGQGFDRQFEDGVVGLSVDSKDSKELSKAILFIVSNYRNISNNCIKYVDKFNWDTIDLQYMDIYKHISSNTSKSN